MSEWHENSNGNYVYVLDSDEVMTVYERKVINILKVVNISTQVPRFMSSCAKFNIARAKAAVYLHKKELA